MRKVSFLLLFIISINFAAADGIFIQNLGLTGFEQINPEYTSSQTVILQLNFSPGALQCRYANHDNVQTMPASGEWSGWETCVESRIWELSDDVGMKGVFYQINYGSYSTFNDTIYYNYTGAGLDTTPPSAPVIVDGDYTNNNQTIMISWYGAYDWESELLQIPLIYYFRLYDGNTLLNNVTTTNTFATSQVDLPHNTIVHANVTVINSANLQNSTMSDGLIIDLEPPNPPDIYGSFYNSSSNRYQSFPDSWIYATNANFSWYGTDELSYIGAYSYVLSQTYNLEPDNVPEGQQANWANQTTVTYPSIASGIFYLKVKMRDAAGNWGNSSVLSFHVDNSPPTSARIYHEERGAGNITYFWTPAYDPETGIDRYRINITGENGDLFSELISDTSVLNWTFTGLSSTEYNATIGAQNSVGIWSWSGRGLFSADNAPPVITAAPKVTVGTNTFQLQAWTDEQAICYYNSGAGDTKFTYTNSTYHESKLTLEPGSYEYDITCTDLYDNYDNLGLEFQLLLRNPDEINGNTNLIGFEGHILNFDIGLNNSGSELAGMEDLIDLTVDTEPYDFSVSSQGDGIYHISMQSPPIGNHHILISVGAQSLSIDVVVTGVLLNGVYNDAFIMSNPLSTGHMTYYADVGRVIGFASNDDGATHQSQQYYLNMTTNEDLYIFNTLSKNNIEQNEPKLSTFLSGNNPSFGYSASDRYYINILLGYEGYNIKSNVGTKVTKGSHTFNILRSGTEIKFEEGSSHRIVLVSE